MSFTGYCKLNLENFLRRRYINKSQNISNENTNNINKQNLEVDYSSNVNNNIDINESETDNLFMSNDNDKYTLS